MTALTSAGPNVLAPSTVPTVRSIAVYARLEIRRVVRNRRYLMFAIGFPVFFYLLYTGVLGDRTSAQAGTWPAYFMVSMAAYGMIGAALSGAVPIAQERASGWTRQLRITPLPPVGWVGAKVLVAYLTSLPALVLVAATAVLVNHVSLPLGTWVTIVGGLALGVVPFAAFGLLIGYVFDVNSAQGAMSISYVGLAVLGGLWAPASTFQEPLATIARIMPT
jgi:ABC-2 type transport system permease protein